MSTPLTLEQMQPFITYINNAFGKRPFTVAPSTEFTAGRVLVATGGGLSVEPVDLASLAPPPVKLWQPETNYFTGTAETASDVVMHDGNLYIVTQDFSSGGVGSFDERVGLSRVSMDSDVQYLEITADASLPFTSGQVISRYRAIRRYKVKAEYSLPNANLDYPRTYNTAVCNSSITTNTVVAIERLAYNVAPVVIGTITFTPDASPEFTEGVIVFNDALMGPGDEALGIIIPLGEILQLRVTTVGTGLEWISTNFLGEFMSYTSVNFNLPA